MVGVGVDTAAPAEVVAKCEPALYLGEDVTKSRDEVWTRVKAA